MSNDFIQMQNDGLSNIVGLSAAPGTAYRCYEDASGAASRFFQSAALLPEGGFLGWQISMDKEGGCHSFAFSSKEAKAAAEDFNWIFSKCAAVSGDSQKLPDDSSRGQRRVYALCRRPSGGADFDKADASLISDMLKMMEESGGAVRILARSDGHSTKGQGEILFILPEAVTLRMHAALSFAFPGTILKEPEGETNLQDDAGLLPTGYMISGMAGILQTLMHRAKEKKSAEEAAFPTEDEDEHEMIIEEEFTPIEDLKLSIRACNCLKRAGIDSVEELRALSDDEFMHIRNLGRKCMEEIKQRLAKETPPRNPIPPAAPDYSAMLDDLIGLQEAKEQIRKIKAFARMKRDMQERSENPVPIALNMEFVGNPGTAKTTAARIIAGILHEEGILSDGGLVETGRADLVAKYEGQTADKVKSVFRQAKGKLLFIDEAYSLVENFEGEFGDEAINAIVQEMENSRQDTIVVFAGYPGKMEEFIARNPGLRSRVPFRIRFNDYSADEMMQIVRLEAEKRGFTLHPTAEEKAAAICLEAAGCPDAGNGRFCRNLAESAVLNYASRVYGSGGDTENRDFVLIAEDFSIPDVLLKKTKTAQIGFRREVESI